MTWVKLCIGLLFSSVRYTLKTKCSQRQGSTTDTVERENSDLELSPLIVPAASGERRGKPA